MATKNKPKITRIKPAINLLSSPQNVNVNGDIEMHPDTLLRYYTQCYERGYKDSNKIKFSKCWDVFFSISITLIITFLTCSNYSFIWNSEEVSYPWIRWIILAFAISFFILFLIAALIRKGDDMTESREKAIGEIINFSIGNNIICGSKVDQKSLPFE